MSLILNIDCAAETSLVQLVNRGKVLGLETNAGRFDHAAFLHPAIRSLLNKFGKQAGDLDAVAVTEGPGSYTGIRIGMATAKGLCLATGKPLILLNRLELMALAMQRTMPLEKGFYCPMIDARRMEVFCALFSEDMQEILPPHAHILSTVSFREKIGENTILVSGSGAEKFMNISEIANLKYLPEPGLSEVFALSSTGRFEAGRFGDLVDSQPFYAKDFYNG